MGYYPRAISGTQGAGQRKMNLAGLLQLGERDPPLIPGGMIPAGVFVIGIFTSIGAVAVGAVGAAAHERYVRGGSAAGAAAKVRQLANGLVERLGFMTAAVCFGMLVATFFAAIGGGFLAFFAGVALVVLAAAFCQQRGELEHQGHGAVELDEQETPPWLDGLVDAVRADDLEPPRRLVGR